MGDRHGPGDLQLTGKAAFEIWPDSHADYKLV